LTEEPRDWTIGELAKATGVTVRTLRHYDQLTLLRPSRRASGGHRRYGASDVSRLYQILSLRSLGLSLAAIASLLDPANPTTLRSVAQDQLEHVSAQLDNYRDLRRRLAKLVAVLEQGEPASSDQLVRILEVTNMTVHLSRIYTRAGDGGETHLGDRSRVRKTDPRIEAYGDVDELSSQIGVAIATDDLPDDHAAWLGRIQNDLYDVGADLAVPANDRQGKTRLRVQSEYVRWLEQLCDEVNSKLEPLTSFVLPGGSPGAAQLHVCRTVCRRAERHILRVDDANPEVVRYMNRLSDLLFILARAANKGRRPLWEPGQHIATAG
jgi:cob(I)alamin adenosyltransferase